MGLFKADFDAWAGGAEAAGLSAAFAFPDPADADLLHTVFWARGDCDMPSAGCGPVSEAFAATPDDPDTLNVYVYGDGQLVSLDPTVRCNRNFPLAGFMRGPDADDNPPPSEAAAPPPMIGIFKRAIKPGQLEALASSFQVVCDMWHDSIPGMLACSVAPDPDHEHVVHDVRIFADGASYAAHVDKSNVQLTEAMEVWFDNYDTSIPHAGVLFMPGDGSTTGHGNTTGDPPSLSSSIEGKPVKLAFNTFHYSHGGMLGRPPSR